MAVSRPLRQRTSHALITLLAASSYVPHGHGTFTLTLFHRNHVRANFVTFCVCHGGVQEGVFQCRIMLFAAVAMYFSRTGARVAAFDHRRALVQVGRPPGALQPLA